MATLEKKIEADNSLVYKIASGTAGVMVLLFLTMKLLGLLQLVELRVLNAFIMFLGVRYALLRTRMENSNLLEYLPGMATGFFTALLSSAIFAVFVMVYLKFDHSFMHYIMATQPFGEFLHPASAALIVMFEGSASGAIIAFALMHLFNRDTVQG
ncbi:MAG: hypothetical protein IPP51_17195 [Bacteroidetes bacterium]|nr:hypothetical protein [Bacteroidota bacterium]